MQCLPLDPQYPPGQFGTANFHSGDLFRGQYVTLNMGIPSFIKLDKGEIPCAVCKRPGRDVKSMLVPGRVTCPSGFKEDYRGSLP